MYLLFITGLILIGASIHLIYTLYKNDPYTSCFVEMTIWRSLIAFMAHLSMLSTMSKQHRFRCDDELFFTFGHPKIYFYILFLIDIPHGLLCFYFAVVVNSLPTSHQLSPLPQQPTSAKSPQAPTSLKLSQSPQAATSPQPPLSPKSPTSPTPPKSP
ncbi:uncharacterized protein LOC126379005 [Pectinophora gossypiella]|uniref:uncharacterized protein LOC126379005 n=1 Tax=Pectinophora gossypiella TaxID=13191 RepID=UPI00214F2A59|nr:uncharacterized protein LOC126379005 [Pectinophora gossypiella]